MVEDQETVKVIRLPRQSAGDVLNSVAQRREWKPRRRPRGVMVSYDFRSEFTIEIDLDDMSVPFDLGFTRWGGVWIGDELFVLPEEDFRKVRNLVYGHATGFKVPADVADPVPADL